MAEMPVFQVQKNLGSAVDYDYVVGKAAADAAVANGYSIDCVAFCSETTLGTDLVQFLRYMNSGYHFYTTNPSQESLQGWTSAPVTPYAALYLNSSVPLEGWVSLKRYVYSAYERSHFFTADTTANPAPAGYALEPYPNRTGYVRPVSRVEFQVTYNGNGEASGVSVTGGNATGQTVKIDGTDYVMQADDALVGYGTGNWIAYNKADSNAWHFQDITVTPADNYSSFVKITFADDKRIALVDNDEDNTTSDVAYEYTLKIYDENLDKTIDFDPKIINRSQEGNVPH